MRKGGIRKSTQKDWPCNLFMVIANHKWRGNCLLLSVSHCCLPNLSKSKPLVQGKVIVVQLVQGKVLPAQLVQVKATCPTFPSHGCLSKSWLLVQVKATCPSQWPLVEAKTACPSQGCLSGLFVNDCLSKARLLVQINGHLPKLKPLVQVKAALLEAVCPRQGTSPRLIVEAAANGHLSTCPSLGYCQWPLAQAKATRPSQGHLPKARPLVQFPSQGCLPMTACPSDGCCQWPLANCCQ